MPDTNLREIHNRKQLISYFDGYSAERLEELTEHKLRRPVVKSYLLEIVDKGRIQSAEEIQNIFSRSRVTLSPIDDELFLASTPTGDIGFVEYLAPRIVTLYSTQKSKELEGMVKNVVLGNPGLDHVWLSGMTMNVLWRVVTRLSKPNRFTRLVFTHDSIFDIDNPPTQEESEVEEENEESISVDADEDHEEIFERRATSFRLVDRIGVIERRLPELQKLYSPLYAISQLRFPSPVGRGGHDFYDNGRVTNRSDNFRDHRAHLLFVVRIYEKLLAATEKKAWYAIKESVGVPGQFNKIVGSPIVVKFSEQLSPRVFDYWINATFNRKRNRFRLWGHPIRLGPNKVHVYGVDRHLWQPIFLELTNKGCIAIVPNGTCGNTIHRLVTNIQKYLEPGAKAFIGDKSFDEIVEESTKGIPYDTSNK